MKRNLDFAIVSTFLIDNIRPSTGSDHGDRCIDIQTVYSEVLEHEYVYEDIANVRSMISQKVPLISDVERTEGG